MMCCDYTNVNLEDIFLWTAIWNVDLVGRERNSNVNKVILLIVP